MPTTQDSLDNGLAVLNRAGINSPVAIKLLNDNPDCVDILVMMEKAKLFNEDVRNNKTLFANLINLVKRLNDTSRKEYDADTKSSLLELYKLLSGDPDVPSLLTATAQKCIVSELATKIYIDSVITIIKLNPPITALFIDELFTNLHSYTRLYKTIHQYVKPKEAADASYLYVLQKPESLGHVQALDGALGLHQYGGPRDWLNSKIFKILADHPQRCLGLLLDFGELDKSHLLDEYRDLLVQNPNLGISIRILSSNNILGREQIQQSLINPDFDKAYDLCRSLRFIHPYHGKVKEVGGFIKQLLKNPELTMAMGVLKYFMEEEIQRDPKISTRPFEEDLEALLASAKIVAESAQSSAKNPSSFFSNNNTCSIAECLERVKNKYKKAEVSKGESPQSETGVLQQTA